MNETKREHLASEDQFPWLVAIGAVGMLVAFVGMFVVLAYARDESGWPFKLGLVMVTVPVMCVMLFAGVRALENSDI